MNEQGLVDALREYVWESKLSDAEAQALADAARVDLWPKQRFTMLVEVVVDVVADERRGISAYDFEVRKMDVDFGEGAEAEVVSKKVVGMSS
jgi:hypothetical protein